MGLMEPGCKLEDFGRPAQLRFRFLDPILSESSFPLPGIERQPEGATSLRISHPQPPAVDLVRTVGSGLLVQRTNLLSPSVTLLPVFKVSQITATMAAVIPFP
jgi:hypothetical protein